MSHCDEDFCKRVDLLERNFAVSSNIFKEYKPIFLDLFQDPSKDQPRAPRSRKQRRPPCNATELFNFCWTLYIFIKGIGEEDGGLLSVSVMPNLSTDAEIPRQRRRVGAPAEANAIN